MSNWLINRINKSIKHQTRVFNENVNDLEIQSRNGKEITLSDGRKMIEFISCSYLGLETHPDLSRAAQEAIDRFGVQFSVARTRAKVDSL